MLLLKNGPCPFVLWLGRPVSMKLTSTHVCTLVTLADGKVPGDIFSVVKARCALRSTFSWGTKRTFPFCGP